jgi:hypothetical protein
VQASFEIREYIVIELFDEVEPAPGITDVNKLRNLVGDVVFVSSDESWCLISNEYSHQLHALTKDIVVRPKSEHTSISQQQNQRRDEMTKPTGKLSVNNKSGHNGVCYDHDVKKFRSYIGVRGKQSSQVPRVSRRTLPLAGGEERAFNRKRHGFRLGVRSIKVANVWLDPRSPLAPLVGSCTVVGHLLTPLPGWRAGGVSASLGVVIGLRRAKALSVDRFYRHKSRLTVGILNIEIADEWFDVRATNAPLVGSCTVLGHPPSRVISRLLWWQRWLRLLMVLSSLPKLAG